LPLKAAPRPRVPDRDAPFAPAAFERLRTHPDFRSVAEGHARANLDFYGALPLLGRWLISDLGRSALTGAALVLDSLPGGLTAAGLIHAASVNRSCSRGRVLGYLQCCEMNGLIVPLTGAPRSPTARLMLTPLFLDQMIRTAALNLASVARLTPEIAPAIPRLEEPDFRRGLFARLGILTASRPDLFAGPSRPVDLFLQRDGGVRLLDWLIIAQRPGRARMLETCAFSRTALGRAGFVSRTHVTRLLADGEAGGLLQVGARHIEFAPALSDDVERHHALVFEALRAAAESALDD
jgi:hypothetical protein